MSTIHIPVLPNEVMEALRIRPGMTAVDATLGGGGHATLILDALGSDGRLFAFDSDEEAIERFRMRIAEDPIRSEALADGRLTLIHSALPDIAVALRERGVDRVDAMLADFGLSSDQLGDASRGFSFLHEGPLDMRFDRSEGVRAADIVNEWSGDELERIFREYGDIREAKRMARAICARRREKRFETTTELAECVRSASRERRLSIHPATKVFQAVRMAVNRETESIQSFLRDGIGLLESGGRIAAISFHSGEDGSVKGIFREDARGCVCPKEFPVCRCGKRARLRIVNRRPIVPNESEILSNPRARSAKLRVAERV